MQDLMPRAEKLAEVLKARRETIVVAESSTGALISAALLGIAGASAYFLRGAVVYTLSHAPREPRGGSMSASEASAPIFGVGMPKSEYGLWQDRGPDFLPGN